MAATRRSTASSAEHSPVRGRRHGIEARGRRPGNRGEDGGSAQVRLSAAHRRIAGQGSDHREVPGPRLSGSRVIRPRPRPQTLHRGGRAGPRTSPCTSSSCRVRNRTSRRSCGRCGARARCTWPPTRTVRARRSRGTSLQLLSPNAECSRTSRSTACSSTRLPAARSTRHSSIPESSRSNLVNSQLARRALDYLVGFNLSPVLWSKIRSNLSAGRVQSPALRLIADRESEDRRVRSARVLEHPRGRARSPALLRPPCCATAERRWSSSRSPPSPPRSRPRRPSSCMHRAGSRCCRHVHPEAPPCPAGPVHHRDAAAGGLEPPRIQREPDHARRAGAVRRRRRRRPHHLHANRFGQPRGGGGGRDPGLRGRHVRPRRGARDAAAPPHAHAQRAGGARSGAPDLAGADPGVAPAARSRATSFACTSSSGGGRWRAR